MADSQVTLAAIAGAHGISGEVRLKLFAEGVDSLKRCTLFHAGERVLTLKSVKPGGNGAIARFAEIADRSAAEALLVFVGYHGALAAPAKVPLT